MPKEIYTIEDLDDIRNDLTENYILKRDLDFNDDDSYDDPSNKSNYTEGEGWEPINDFNGTIDGDGHIIKNLYMDRDLGDLGFLGQSDEDFTIKKLGLVDVDMSGEVVGGFVGAVRGNVTIEDCFVFGEINGSFYQGGVIALGNNANSLNIKRTYSIVRLTGSYGGAFFGTIDKDITDTGGLYSAGVGEDGFGYSPSDINVEKSYYDEDTLGTSVLGTPLISDWMKGDRAEGEMEGFDFDNDWMALVDGAYFEEDDNTYRIEGGDGYPVLRTFGSIRKQLDAQNRNAYITERPKIKELRTYYVEFDDYEEKQEQKGIDVILSESFLEERTDLNAVFTTELGFSMNTFLDTILYLEGEETTMMDSVLNLYVEELSDLDVILYQEFKEDLDLNTVLKDFDFIADTSKLKTSLIMEEDLNKNISVVISDQNQIIKELSVVLSQSDLDKSSELNTILYNSNLQESISVDTIIYEEVQDATILNTYLTDEGKERAVELVTSLNDIINLSSNLNTILLDQPRYNITLDVYLSKEWAEKFVFLTHSIVFEKSKTNKLGTTLIGKMDIESTDLVISDIEQIFKEFSQPANLIKPTETLDAYGRAYERTNEVLPVDIIVAPSGESNRQIEEFGETNYGRQSVYLLYEYEKHGEKFKPKNGDRIKDSKGKEWKIVETNRWRWNYRLVFYKVEIISVYGEK